MRQGAPDDQMVVALLITLGLAVWSAIVVLGWRLGRVIAEAIRARYEVQWNGWREAEVGFWRPRYALSSCYLWFVWLGPVEARRCK